MGFIFVSLLSTNDGVFTMNDQQFYILVLFLFLGLIISTVFFIAYQSSQHVGGEKAQGISNPNMKRMWLFVFLATVVVILLSVTLPKSPYFVYADSTPDKVIYAVAQQFLFKVSEQAISAENLGIGEKITLQKGELVEFRVTSSDVNHGFVIYDENNAIIAQTQAMPGYVNRLRWVFNESGIYNILCLEFCGAGHALMRTTITVN